MFSHAPAGYVCPFCRNINDGTSDLDFDFWAWGMEKYERVIAEFDSSDFGRALEEVRQGD